MSQLQGDSAFTRLAMFLTDDDPGASRMASPLVRFVLKLVAATGKLRGVKPLPPS